MKEIHAHEVLWIIPNINGIEHNAMPRGKKTSVMILEMQLLQPINLEMDVKSSKKSGVHHSTVKKFIDSIQDSCQSSHEWISQQAQPKIRWKKERKKTEILLCHTENNYLM